MNWRPRGTRPSEPGQHVCRAPARDQLIAAYLVGGVVTSSVRRLDDDLLDEVETALLTADVGVTATTQLVESLRGFKRQALHAETLEFAHPVSGEPIRCSAPMPADMQALIATLRQDTAEAEERAR